MTSRKLLVPSAMMIAAVLVSAPAQAHEGDATHTLTVNPFDLVSGLINFELEAALSPLVSVYGGVNFLVWEGVWSDDARSTFAVGPELGLRLFLLGDAPAGLWVGPFAGLAYVRVERDGQTGEALGAYAGGMAGLTLVFFDALAISGGIGAGYHDLGASVNGQREGLRGPVPRLRFAAGFAF